jgi:hypothetical protein
MANKLIRRYGGVAARSVVELCEWQPLRAIATDQVADGLGDLQAAGLESHRREATGISFVGERDSTIPPCALN